jgi:hypothetical protein
VENAELMTVKRKSNKEDVLCILGTLLGSSYCHQSKNCIFVSGSRVCINRNTCKAVSGRVIHKICCAEFCLNFKIKVETFGIRIVLFHTEIFQF